MHRILITSGETVLDLRVAKAKALQTTNEWRIPVLWTLFVILLVLWLLGFVAFHVVAWYIHLLLVVALIVLVIQLVSGRKPVV